MSLSQQVRQNICILSASGAISFVSLLKPGPSADTVTYKGPMQIVSLSGILRPTESGWARTIAAGMSITVVSPNGNVAGGALAGVLVAGSPVQVVVGIFEEAGDKNEQKPEEPKYEIITTAPPIAAADWKAVTEVAEPKNNPLKRSLRRR